MRWGPGPVFVYECLVNSRRWQTYALRAGGLAALLFAMATIAMSSVEPSGTSPRDYARLGQAYFVALIGVELALVILVAPAATAGAICLDRARGTLAHMLMTDLSDPEIVLGKLAARLLPVLCLVACTWPVMAISSLLGGIDPIALTLAFAIIVAVAVLGCTMALALSVWARKTHEVILTTYTVFILGVLFWPVWYLMSAAGVVRPPPQWALLPDPFYVAFAASADPGKVEFWDYVVFFGAVLGASALLTLIAVWRTRPVACRGSAETSKQGRMGLIGRVTRWLPGPSLDRNPVLWREWHRSRPSLWMTAVLGLLMGTTAALCLVGAATFWNRGIDVRGIRIWEIAGICSYVMHVTFGLLMLAAIAPTSMAEERQRGSLDILAATALSTRAIVIGKWLGTFRLVLLMAIGPGLMALAMATARQRSQSVMMPGMRPDLYRVIPLGARLFGVFVVIATILAHGALYSSLGLGLAIWIKRQSRAIALSVGAFILITAVWPIVVLTISRSGPPVAQNIGSLSPVMALGTFVTYLTSRTNGFVVGFLWWAIFWAIEVFAVAMTVLWLAVRTFDECFDRVADRPRQFSISTALVSIYCAMIGAGSLIWAIAIWFEGVNPAEAFSRLSSVGIMAYFIMIAIGLALGAVESARSLGAVPGTESDIAPRRRARSFLLGRWWASFRLVMLLATGPALVALALVIAHEVPRYEPQFKTNAQGVQVFTSYVLARSDIPRAGALPLDQRMMIATTLVVTILAHGGAAIAVGLGLGTAQGWRRRVLGAAVCLILIVAVVVPFNPFADYDGRANATGMWSFLMAARSLLAMLVARTLFTTQQQTLGAVLYSDGVLVLFTVATLGVTTQAWRRRFSRSRERGDRGLHPGLARAMSQRAHERAGR